MNPSTALATVIVSALADLGVRQVVLCPGSRSAPLAYALATAADAGRIRLHVRVDERAAGFLALGLAKGAPGTPAAVITTSGTAVANLYPAVLEASHAGVPMLVISADRPHELRGTGASQTTDQVRMFGTAVRWFAEIPAPHRQSGQVVGWRNVLARAVAAACGNPGADPGPVQLNVAFDDPLTPDPAETIDRRKTRDRPEQTWPESLPGTAGLTAISAAAAPVAVRLPSVARTVVLAGDDAGAEAAEVAEAMGWPLLAEPSSGARTGHAIGPYRLLLDLPNLGAAIERVVVFGRPTLSRPVSRLLARPNLDVVVVSQRPDWSDAGRQATLVVPAVAVADPPVDRWSDASDLPEADPDWWDAWRVAGRAAASAIDALLDEEATAGRLTGPLIAREVAAVTGPGDVLFAGSSNPIRDLDLTAAPFDPAARVLANRGLAGIDGTLASASGVALSGASLNEMDRSGAALSGADLGRVDQRGLVRCLVGDLTFLHDVGALLVGPLEEQPRLQIVVVDDDGGGIFSLLEHGARAELGTLQNAHFERVFATPQRVDLGALCAGYRVAHQIVGSVRELRKALVDPLPGMSVIQIKVDRSAHRALTDRLRAAALAALAS
ncbi:MAG TPA: 2-succinyl-5-enolpyruvyl-6-hydroxy-3-cyclohexene-1-carboxylic-acid synthase [Kineosporiaceae bacterium]|nr:2-succinyl-5-enolpyruvyl-6-hydroxy-3-cyclohexene-1-carboxylic-acid synthase [Kineosporiaceae bacterium]